MLVSNLLQGLKVLSNIGMETLYLCGNEWIVKSLFPAFISLFGVQVIIDSPLKAWLYSVVLILITYKCVIPVEKQVINIVKEISPYILLRENNCRIRSLTYDRYHPDHSPKSKPV